MYLRYYGIREHPFGVTPNPQFLYHSTKHREALATLIYGIEARRGFMALIGKAGMGKTTLLFELLGRLGNTARTVFLFQTQCDSREFFHYLLSDLGIDCKGQDLAGMHEKLNQVLLAEARAGRPLVLIIDEAQNLADSVLETVRLLSDFETPRAKLMQIILAGQPQLAEKLALPSLVQLRQRISLFARLEPLSQEETRAYIDRRLKVAGYTRSGLFAPEAIEMIAERGKGIPSDINNICFNALSLGFALQKKKIDSAIMHEVFADLNLGTLVEEATEVPRTPVVLQPVSRDVQPVAQEASDARMAPVQQPVSRAAQRIAQEAFDFPMPPVQEPVSRAGPPAAQEASDVLMTPAVQRPVSPDAPPAAKDTAQSAPKVAGVGRRPALWVGALAATALVAAGFLVYLREKARIGEHVPLAQTVSASNSTGPAPTVSRRLGIRDLSSASAGHTVPHALPFVRKATPRESKLEGVRSQVVPKPGNAARKVAGN